MNRQSAEKQIRKYITEFGKKFNASIEELNSIAMKESSRDPYIGLHPDGVSYGLMGITNDVEKEYRTYNGEFLDRENLKDNIKLSAWYWGERIPQMIEYFGAKNTLRNRVIAYNAGISYVVNGNEIPERTKGYIQHMQEGKKKTLISTVLALLLGFFGLSRI